MHLLKESTKIYWHDRLLWKYFIKHIPVQIRPNHITAARFILTPLVVWLVWRGDYAWGVPLFAVTSFTDTIDGTMARMRGQITKWGIVFDPIADKLLVSSVLLVLIVRHLSAGVRSRLAAFGRLAELRSSALGGDRRPLRVARFRDREHHGFGSQKGDLT